MIFRVLAIPLAIGFGCVLGDWLSSTPAWPVINVVNWIAFICLSGFLIHGLLLAPSQAMPQTSSSAPAALDWTDYVFLERDEPNPRRVHLDENQSNATFALARRRGLVVSNATTASLKGAKDEEQLEYARRHGAILVTHDRDFVILHGGGKRHCGILVAPNEATAEDIIARCLQIESR